MADFPSNIDLFRWVHPTFILPDGISSAAFKDDELSCDDSRVCAAEATHRRMDRKLRGNVAQFVSGFAIAQSQTVQAQAEIDNPAHVLVLGKKTKSCARKFAAECDRRGWAFSPTPPKQPGS